MFFISTISLLLVWRVNVALLSALAAKESSVATLGAGPSKTFNGKELSQDAVIWVQVRNVK
jgi:hypothetical protein